jgi:FkbM family methyltransferase
VSENRLPEGVVRHIARPLPSDERVIRTFPNYEGPGTPGFVTDFLGVKTRLSYFSHLGSYDGKVQGYPLPGDVLYSSIEWAGTLRSVLQASDEVVAVELGAGWGPWLVAAAVAGRMRGITRARLVGVEGSRHHYEYMFTHFRDNGLDPGEHTLLHGIAAQTDGTAEFPVLDDPTGDWGAAAVLAPDEPAVRHARTEKLPAYSLGTLLAPFRVVDVIHIDIQGHEADVVAAGREVLREKAKRLVIGTHGRAIEGQLIDELGPRGWVLESEEPCIFRQDPNGLHLYIDGVQVWRNSALCPAY